MKKLMTLTAIIVISLFFAACGDEDPTISGYDNENQTDNETGDENGEHTDVDQNETEEEETTDDAVDNNVDIPDDAADNNVEIPDNNNQFDKVGEFSLMFNGQVNVDLSNYQNIKGGEGDVNFSHNGMNLTFTKQSIFILQLFPIAILQQSNVAILWLDSAPGLGAETKQVFGFTFPSTVQQGETTMEAAQAFAFYGDININLQGGQFDVKCIRSAAIAGSLNMTSYTGTNANLTASGDLLDPTAAGSQLPYPVCTD